VGRFDMKIKSIIISKTTNDGHKITKIINSEKAQKHLESLNSVKINKIINEIEKIKDSTSKKNKKQNSSKYLLRKIKNLIKKRNELLLYTTYLSENILSSIENEIFKYYSKYLKEDEKTEKNKKIIDHNFEIACHSSILSIDTKRNKH
jgi:hypothetical protein